jgi:hypothetical protein
MMRRKVRRSGGSEANEFAFAFAWLQDNKRIGAWLAFVLIAVSTALKGVVPALLPVAGLLYVSVLTSLVVDIHRRTTVARTIYPSHQEAAGVFFEEITKALRSRGKCELSWIGVTMQSAWLTLENALGRAIADGQIADLHIRLLQSDGEFLGTILGQSDNQPQLAREQAEQIARFGARHEGVLGATGSTIALAQYAYMPNFHGLLVNDDVLYLSTVRWTGSGSEELSVPHEPFERFDRTTSRGRYMIELYTAWLDKGFEVATSVREFPRPTSSPDEDLDGVVAAS